MKQSVRTFMEDKHSMYSDFNQAEREDCRQMVELGHPKAASYEQLRRLFDRLKYAANASARYFSCIDSNNFSQVWAPQLDISWHNRMEIDGRFYCEVYPAMGEVWDKYIAENAKQNWKNADPSLDIGGIVVSTTDESMAQAVANTRTGKASKVSTTPDDEGVYRFQVFPMRIRDFYEIIRVVKHHHKGYVLPKRTLVDDKKDSTPLPMSQKKTMLANVKEPVVEARSVLIPLIPMNDTGTRIAHKNVEFLVECLDDGLPWAEAETHLKSTLKADAYRQVQQRFSQS